MPAFEFHRTVQFPDGFEVVDQALRQFHPELAIRNLPALVNNDGFYFVTIFQEIDRMFEFELVIVIVGGRTKTQFLELSGVRLLTLILLLFLQFITVFAIVEDLADRWLRVRNDFQKVQTVGAGHLQSLFDAHDAHLLTILPDKPDLRCPNILVDPYFVFFGDGWVSLIRLIGDF